MKFFQFVISLICLPFIFHAQDNFDLNNWHHLDPGQDKIYGVSTDRMYGLLAGKQPRTVVVAVIDSGVDIEHEDLKEKIWVNTDEIPDNGKDDDLNGYIDDIHGWNFIGGKTGEPVIYDTYEITRLYREDKDLFAQVNPDKLKGKAKAAYEIYLQRKEKIEEEMQKAEKNYEETVKYEYIINTSLTALKDALGENDLSQENVSKIDDAGNVSLSIAKQIIDQVLTQESEEITIDELIEDFAKDIVEQKEYFQGKFLYNYNPDYDPRHIVGDNYRDVNQKYYGNNQVFGPKSDHGTHVAGIIGAQRGNRIGMDGIADHVRIMPIRAVPEGDERDKDIINAIYYAVDNGASIINMSFGKGQSPYKKEVDAAIRYAEKNDVLIVHAAGNASMDNDEGKNFPTDQFSKKGLFARKYAKNWLEVGALSYQKGENIVAPFSNYGEHQVDLFAPGMSIYSTLPQNSYKPQDGTSMAAPVVSGVAAVIRSYHPNLSAKQVKEILVNSSIKVNQEVVKPGTEEIVSFANLSVSGGVVNAYKAFQLASDTKGKQKSKKLKSITASTKSKKEKEKKRA